MIPEWLAIWGTVVVTGGGLLFGYRQFRLNRMQIDQAKAELDHSRKADMGAAFHKVGSSNYRLRIFNNGKSDAINVRLEFPQGKEFLSDADIASKFPMEKCTLTSRSI